MFLFTISLPVLYGFMERFIGSTVKERLQGIEYVRQVRQGLTGVYCRL